MHTGYRNRNLAASVENKMPFAVNNYFGVLIPSFLLVVFGLLVSSGNMPTPISNVRTASATAVSLDSIRMVTFNIAGCVPSKSAPPSWNAAVTTEAIATEVSGYNPDVLVLQEWPTRNHAKILRTFPSHQVLGTAASHAKNVVLLVRKGINARLVSTGPGGVVLAELSHKDRKILVAGVHLTPFKELSDLRQKEIEVLSNYARSVGLSLLLAGDTNMRESEDLALEDGRGLSDAWKLAGSDPGNQFTWDTRDHTTKSITTTARGGEAAVFVNGSFNRYYGERTRQYAARYDRIYFFPSDDRSGRCHLEGVKVDSFELFANRPLTNPYHFLSDHFGVSTVLSLKWKT